MKVLIAEDDMVSGMVLERTLQRWGYDVIKTKNGTEAWELFQQEPVSLVITDWEMPGLSGLELCRCIRQFTHEHYTYIILLSSKSQKIELVEGMNAGADDFITKPFDNSELQVRLCAGERILALEHSLTERQKEIQAANKSLEQSVQRQHLINQLLGSLTSSLDFEVLLQSAVEPLQALFHVSRAVVRLVHNETQTLRIVAERCAVAVPPLGAISYPIEPVIDGEEADRSSSCNYSDLAQIASQENNSLLQTLVEEHQVKSLLTEPLFIQGMWFGDLSLQQCDQQRVWTDDEIRLLQTIAQQISVVAVNSELHRKVQEQSVRDGLTGLFNRRYFDESLAIEFERASRYSQPLTLVMLDLDYLKKINDEMGHLAGDLAIKQMGEVLLKQSRRVDIATRYGGEEFIVILPQTPLSGGKTAGEYWRLAINNCFVGSHQLSASIGVASFPEHANSPHELIQAADVALYRAKKEGRNRVCAAHLSEE
ncbi:MAG TPA: diguanylate cyclase [Blastocatellia bacterium]|nr:diguanylate cyclase [Blastocatellia bacterium]